MSVNIAGLQEMKIERMLASDLSGLTFGRMESTGQHQKDALGNVSSLESSVMRDVDLTALPGYLRKVLGNPVTVESLERVVDFYRDSTIAEATPAISFGVWEARGQKGINAGRAEYLNRPDCSGCFQGERRRRCDFGPFLGGHGTGSGWPAKRVKPAG